MRLCPLSPGPPPGGKTRCMVEIHWSLVHCAIISPMLTWILPGRYGTSSHFPPAVCTCKPGLSAVTSVRVTADSPGLQVQTGAIRRHQRQGAVIGMGTDPELAGQGW